MRQEIVYLKQYLVKPNKANGSKNKWLMSRKCIVEGITNLPKMSSAKIKHHRLKFRTKYNKTKYNNNRLCGNC